jgi:ABC-type Fe3+ transport system substrate-binding protein
MNKSGGWTPGSIRPGGWLIILLIVAAIYWVVIKPRMSTLHSLANLLVAIHIPGSSNNSAAVPFGGEAQGADILILTTGTKKAWLSEEIDKFSTVSQGGRAEMDILESRDGMQKILAGAEKPDLWSPSSTVWTDRLAEIGPSANIRIHQDNDSMRTLFQSPLVFLVNKNDLQQLQPILAGRYPFDTLARSGRYKFAYADPLAASSGMLTMSLLLNEYADIHDSYDLDSVASSQDFAIWLRKVDRGLERQHTEGSSALESDFENNPGDRAFITTYENAALQAAANNSNFAVVYPNPTADATQAAALVDGPWTTEAKRETVKQFLDFITSDTADSDAVNFYFRPASNGDIILGQRVSSTAAAAYFRPDFRTVDLPSYNAINDANVIWHEQGH